jgi:hypothetical protein
MKNLVLKTNKYIDKKKRERKAKEKDQEFGRETQTYT